MYKGRINETFCLQSKVGLGPQNMKVKEAGTDCPLLQNQVTWRQRSVEQIASFVHALGLWPAGLREEEMLTSRLQRLPAAKGG